MTEEERDNYYFEFVHDDLGELLAALIDTEDGEEREAILGQIKELHQELSREGYWHPFVTEAVADTAEEPSERIHYYKLALEQAREMRYGTHSILIDMAACLMELGQTEQAEACAEEGLRGALDSEDYDYITRAEQVLRGELD